MAHQNLVVALTLIVCFNFLVCTTIFHKILLLTNLNSQTQSLDLVAVNVNSNHVTKLCVDSGRHDFTAQQLVDAKQRTRLNDSKSNAFLFRFYGEYCLVSYREFLTVMPHLYPRYRIN